MRTKVLNFPVSSRVLRCISAIAVSVPFAMTASAPLMAADLETSTPPAAVADQPLPPQWSFEVAPYFWAASLSGQVASFGASGANVDMNFAEILGDLDFSAMVAGEARYGRFSLTTELIYLKLSTDETTPLGILVSDIDLDSTTTAATALAGYSVLERPNIRLDVLAGARLWSVENTLNFNGGFFGGRSFNDSATWVDAMGGVRARFDFADRFYLTGTALAGGGSSNFGWDLMGGVGYEFSRHFSAFGGYRALGVDYQDGGFEFDVTIQGPILGGVIRF